MSGDYKVGRGKPPLEHRFSKGKSGNPKGRPKRKRDAGSDQVTRVADQLILEEAMRVITVREGNRAIELTAFQAAVRSMGIAAMKGNRLAQRDLVHLVLDAEARKIKDSAAKAPAAQPYLPPPIYRFYGGTDEVVNVGSRCKPSFASAWASQGRSAGALLFATSHLAILCPLSALARLRNKWRSGLFCSCECER